ncbi:MAG: hypothetical protein EOM22_12475 [Gammaproteobacteria bacterium]|nr:hypothetical protein [Gammaproteobacteria bacterium]
MTDVDDLISYLDTDLSIDTLREMDRVDLYRLRELLYHWHELADRIYRDRRALSVEEESE